MAHPKLVAKVAVRGRGERDSSADANRERLGLARTFLRVFNSYGG